MQDSIASKVMMDFYLEGWHARDRSAEGYKDCPFVMGSPARVQWFRGYNAANAELQRLHFKERMERNKAALTQISA